MIKKTHSAGGVIFSKSGYIVLVSKSGMIWTFPKGHIEEGEDSLTAAYREIKEETGISKEKLECVKRFKSYRRYNIGKKRELKIITMYQFRTQDDSLLPDDPDSLTAMARWFYPEMVVRALTHRKDKEFFRKHFRQFCKK